MLLRSSSTPILSVLQACPSSLSPALHSSESPANAYHAPSTVHTLPRQPASSSATNSPLVGSCFRRARSAGNLASLADSPTDASLHKHHGHASRALNPIPSFSIHEQTSLDKDDKDMSRERELAQVWDSVAHLTSGEPQLFLARGLGIDSVGSGLLEHYRVTGDDTTGGGIGGGSRNRSVTHGNGGDHSDIESYYKWVLAEDPNNALILRNYAQLLHKVKGDVRRAEEYYSRAILADPNDGEVLSEYASLIWSMNRDEERASSYFKQAIRASPHNSNVHALYAAFLWETDGQDCVEDEAGGGTPNLDRAVATTAI